MFWQFAVSNSLPSVELPKSWTSCIQLAHNCVDDGCLLKCWSSPIRECLPIDVACNGFREASLVYKLEALSLLPNLWQQVGRLVASGCFAKPLFERRGIPEVSSCSIFVRTRLAATNIPNFRGSTDRQEPFVNPTLAGDR